MLQTKMWLMEKVLNLLERGMMKISRSTSMELTPGQMQEQN